MKRQLISSLLAAAMVASAISAPAFAYNNPQTDTSVTESEVASAQISMQIAKEGIVLLENNNDALPIASEGDVALFGIAAIQTTKGGTGSGAVNNRIVYADGSVVEGEAIATSILDGFENAGYNVLTKDYLVALDEAAPLETGGLGMGRSNLADDTALSECFTALGDVAQSVTRALACPSEPELRERVERAFERRCVDCERREQCSGDTNEGTRDRPDPA